MSNYDFIIRIHFLLFISSFSKNKEYLLSKNLATTFESSYLDYHFGHEICDLLIIC